MQKRVRMALLLALLLAVLPLCGCSEGAETVFSKTIYDFEGLRVVSLDGQEDTNFVVYAPEAQEIRMEENSNLLIAADAENGIYTFAQPDRTLLSLKAGDVCWAEASPMAPNGLAVKVQKTERSEDTLIVYSGETALEDFFAYVDIDMDMPLRNAYYDDALLEGEMEIAVSDAAGTQQSAAVPDDSQNWDVSLPTQIVLRDAVDLALGQSSGSTAANAHLNLEYEVAISRIRVRFQFSAKERRFSSDVSFDSVESTTGSVEFEGQWNNGANGKTWPVFSVPIPYTPIVVSGDLCLHATLSGKMKGSFRQSSSFTVGMSGAYEPYCAETGNTSDVALELEGDAELLFGARMKVGVPHVADVFLESNVGPRLAGTVGAREQTDEDCIHDCDLCLDGDISLVGRAECGVDARLMSEVTGWDLSLRKEMGGIQVKLGDFYASYRQGADGGAECGWGECPYRRWKVLVSALTKEGEAAANANVRAQYPDGRTAAVQTDGAGTAVLYLPDGDNLVSCAYRGERGSAHAMVNGGLASLMLRLEDKRQIFICYSFCESDNSLLDCMEFSELYALLSEQYPDAIWISMDEWMSHTDSSNTTHSNYSMAGMQEAYGLSAGDLVLYPFAMRHQYSTAVNGEVRPVVGDFCTLSLNLGIALLPQERQGEVPSEIPEMIWLYKLSATLQSEGHYLWGEDGILRDKTNYLDEVLFWCSESCWQGLEYDENDRIREIGTEWLNRTWEDAAPTFGAVTTYDYYANMSRYRALLAAYAEYAFPQAERAISGD